MSKLKAVLPVLVAIAATWWLTTPSVAQSSIPNGVFVRNSEGVLWLVMDGQRVKIPVWSASDEEIAALPVPDRWAVMNDAGAIVAGDRPAWLPSQGSASISAVRADPTATPKPVPTATPRTASDSLSFNGLTLKVMKIERGWKSDNQFIKPKAGREYVTIDVRIDNDTSEQQDMNPARFKVVTEDGVRWDSSSARDPYLKLGDVIPGTPMRGWLTFEVPRNLGVIQLLWEADYKTTLVLSIKA
jgi:hypothetical protein